MGGGSLASKGVIVASEGVLPPERLSNRMSILYPFWVNLFGCFFDRASWALVIEDERLVADLVYFIPCGKTSSAQEVKV